MGKFQYEADVVIIGGGLAGIAAALELIDKGCSVALIDRGPEERFGGLAKLSFGGLFFVDSPEQRRMGIRDSHELALQDRGGWMNRDIGGWFADYAALVGKHFGDRLHASSTKGWTGHTLGAAGIVESVFALLALERGLLPGMLGSDAGDDWSTPCWC